MTLNSAPSFKGIEKTYQITSKAKRILVPSAGETKAVLTDRFRTNDRVWIVGDNNGNAVAAFITERVTNSDKEEEHFDAQPSKEKCKHCGKVVEWKDWYDQSSLPTTSSHYRLERDGQLTGQMSMAANAEICLDLNGHTFVSHENSRVYSVHNEGGKLSLMDFKGGGGFKSQGKSFKAQGAMLWARYGELHIYDGTYDASNTVNESSGNVIEGSANSKVYIYGGKYIGGIVYVSSNGKLTLHGGKFSGGKADRFGGCFGVEGKMVMDGGNISGCDSAKGKILYVTSTGTVDINGGHVDGSKENNIEGTGKIKVADDKYIQ